MFYLQRGAIKIQNIKNRVLQIFNIKDCPYKLAKSMALGFGLAFLPLPGINIPLGVLLAKMLRLNIVVTTLPALLLTYVSPILYILNYKTGALFITSSERLPQSIAYDLSFWDRIIDFFTHAGPAYLLGSIINASLVAVLAYFIFPLIYKNSSKLFKKKDTKSMQIKNKAPEDNSY